MAVRVWDEAKHPRDPGGEGGGQWISGADGMYEELGVDDATIVSGVRAALAENPGRLTHGNTGRNGFWVVGSDVYVWDDKAQIPRGELGHAVGVHSHAPDAVLRPEHLDTYFPASGVGSDNVPFSTGDLKILGDDYLKGGGSPRMAVLHGDGTMDILGFTYETNPKALYRKSDKTLRKEIGRNRDDVREWATKNGFDYRERVRWASPDEVLEIRRQHPHPSLMRASALTAAFDPSQPRAPAGGPEGGQWLAVGTRVTPVYDRRPIYGTVVDPIYRGEQHKDDVSVAWDDGRKQKHLKFEVRPTRPGEEAQYAPKAVVAPELRVMKGDPGFPPYFPEGVFAPADRVAYWPKLVGHYQGSPLWKALVLKDDPSRSVFWIADPMGQPSHGVMFNAIKAAGEGPFPSSTPAMHWDDFHDLSGFGQEPISGGSRPEFDRVRVEHAQDIRDAQDIVAAQESLSRDYTLTPGMAAAAFDESKHPRHPAGSDAGGEFAPQHFGPGDPGFPRRFPDGVFSPADDVVFWPLEIGANTMGTKRWHPMWKALVSRDRLKRVFWFVDPMGAPHHEDMLSVFQGGMPWSGEAVRDEMFDPFDHPHFLSGFGWQNQWATRNGADHPLAVVTQKLTSKNGDAIADAQRIVNEQRDDAPSRDERLGLAAAGFDPTKHPRHPAGSDRGGEWAPKVLGFGDDAFEGTWSRDPDDLLYDAFDPQVVGPYVDGRVVSRAEGGGRGSQGFRVFPEADVPVVKGGVWWKASYYEPTDELKIWVPGYMGGPHHVHVAEAMGWDDYSGLRDFENRMDIMGAGSGDGMTAELQWWDDDARLDNLAIARLREEMAKPSIRAQLRAAERHALGLVEDRLAASAADPFQVAWEEGQRQAETHLGGLQAAFEGALLAEGRKIVKAYKQSNLVAAAEQPGGNTPLSQIIDEILFKEAVLAAVRATQLLIVSSVVLSIADDPKLARLPVYEMLLADVNVVQSQAAFEAVSDSVNKVLLESLTEGWDVPDTAERLNTVLTDFAPWQATRLARTSLISLANGSSLLAAQALGEDAPTFKTWLTAGDELVRPTHVQADRQTVPTDQPFDVDGVPMMFPGDPSAPDALKQNCRCTLVYGSDPHPLLAYSEDWMVPDGELALSAAFNPLQPRDPGGEGGGQWVNTFTVEPFTKETWARSLEGRSSDLTFPYGDILPSEILAYHEPWMQHVRYAIENGVSADTLRSLDDVTTTQAADWLDDHPESVTEPTDPANFTAAAWDESKYVRHPAGSERGGEFAPKVITYDDTLAQAAMRDWVDRLDMDDVYTDESVAFLRERLDGTMQTALPLLQGRLDAAGVGAWVSPQLDMEQIDVLANPQATFSPNFDVSLGPEPFAPGFSVWTFDDGHVEVEDVLDLGDTDFFPAGPESPLAQNYAKLVDAAGAEPGRPDTVTLYRGMSPAEMDAWKAGEPVPSGKFFTDKPTVNYAQDQAGVFPELQTFTVPRSSVMRTGPNEFQLSQPARLVDGRLAPVSARIVPADPGRYPAAEGGHPRGWGLGADYRIRDEMRPGQAPKHGVQERARDRRARRRVLTAAFDESKVSRQPSGTRVGGQFRSATHPDLVGSARDEAWTGPPIAPSILTGAEMGGTNVDFTGIGRSDQYWTQHERDVAARAEVWGVTPEGYKDQIAHQLQQEAKDPLVIRTPMYGYNGADPALDIIESGRFMAQMESGVSQGAFAPDIRAAQEKLFFGYPIDMAPELRPIYGMVDNIESHSVAHNYGDVLWVLKDDIRTRTTVTGIDSLSRPVVPGPISNPGWRATVPPGYDANVQIPIHDQFADGFAGNPDYVEAQFHGGVSLKDVDHVDLINQETGAASHKAHVDLLRAKLAPHGITVRAYEDAYERDWGNEIVWSDAVIRETGP